MDPTFKPWSNTGTCYHNMSGIFNRKYMTLITFDFDDTLVDLKTKQILPGVKETLVKWYNENECQPVIFSNQMGISKNKTTHEEVRKHFEDFMKELNIPIVFFYSTVNDKYRKPNIGMIELCRKKFSKMIKSYCGDAAGRENDFNISDLYFANNANIPFITPEAIQSNLTEKKIIEIKDTPKLELYTGDIWENGKLSNPRKLFDIIHINQNKEIIPEIDLSKKILVMMIGTTGVGKSSLSSILSEKYNLEVISPDRKGLTKSIAKLSIRHGLESKNGVIIDSCNHTKKSRESWLELFNDKDIKIFYMHFNISKSISIHLTRYREFYNNECKNIPIVAIHKIYKNFEPPTLEENENIITFDKPITLANDFNYNYRFVW